jgi:hypothetical protein
MITEFLIKWWELVIIGFLVLNLIIQKIEKIKGRSDILTWIWQFLTWIVSLARQIVTMLFSTTPGKLPMIFIGLFLMGSLMAGQVFAEPFLKAGATLNATKWQIDLNGVIIEAPVDSEDATTAWLKYDLIGLAEGDHSVKVRAGNAWGWSQWYPLDGPLTFTKALADVLIVPYIE